MWFVYLLRHTETEQTYIGATSDLKKRLQQHNRGEQKSTRRKDGRWMLVYTEVYRSKDDAFEREKRLKSHGSAKHELFKRIRKSLLTVNYETPFYYLNLI